MVVESKRAFGEKGYPDLGVPPNKDVTYIIEMKNFERVGKYNINTLLMYTILVHL